MGTSTVTQNMLSRHVIFRNNKGDNSRQRGVGSGSIYEEEEEKKVLIAAAAPPGEWEL